METKYMISTEVSFHWVRRITARMGSEGVLRLTFHGDENVTDEQFNTAEIMIFTEDPEMVGRLVAAINGAAEPPMMIDENGNRSIFDDVDA